MFILVLAKLGVRVVLRVMSRLGAGGELLILKDAHPHHNALHYHSRSGRTLSEIVLKEDRNCSSYHQEPGDPASGRGDLGPRRREREGKSLLMRPSRLVLSFCSLTYGLPLQQVPSPCYSCNLFCSMNRILNHIPGGLRYWIS